MSKNTVELPYTEIVERVKSITRSPDNAIEKVRGVVQDIYTRDIPVKHDWTFLFASSSIVTTAEYKTGNASATTGSRIISFSSDAIMIDSMNGRKIKFAGNEVVYEVTSFMAVNSLQVLPEFQGASNITNGSYTVFQPVYALAGDFDRFPKNGGIYKWSGGNKEIMDEAPYSEYAEDYNGNPSVPERVRLVSVDTAGNQLIEFSPPPKDARVYSYDYYRRLSPLQETSAGHISSIPAKSLTVTGYTTARFVDAGTDSNTLNFLRIDVYGKGQDSSWYSAVISHDSAIALRTAFANSAVTSSANFVVSNVPRIPSMLHPAIMYGAVAHILADQNDDMAAVYMGRYAQVLSDAKRIYVSRTYSQDIHGVQEDWDYRR